MVENKVIEGYKLVFVLRGYDDRPDVQDLQRVLQNAQKVGMADPGCDATYIRGIKRPGGRSRLYFFTVAEAPTLLHLRQWLGHDWLMHVLDMPNMGTPAHDLNRVCFDRVQEPLESNYDALRFSLMEQGATKTIAAWNSSHNIMLLPHGHAGRFAVTHIW